MDMLTLLVAAGSLVWSTMLLGMLWTKLEDLERQVRRAGDRFGELSGLRPEIEQTMEHAREVLDDISRSLPHIEGRLDELEQRTADLELGTPPPDAASAAR